MSYIILGSDCRHIYGYATTLEKAKRAVKKLNYTQNEEVFYEELKNLDDLELPEKLYVTVSETSSNQKPKIRKFRSDDLEKTPIQNSLIKACETEEFRKARLFMYQHFVINTKKKESKERLHERILKKYNELFEKNLKNHLKSLSDERR